VSATEGVEEYLAALPDDQRAALESLRRVVATAAPGATETISYGIPTFKHEGRGVVAYAAFKAHCSLFPTSTKVTAALGEEVRPFLASKGTLHFTPERPLPPALVERIVKARLEENAARARVSA
jgi:uncharacterized protein YdhG (YjbR/CyaY superfamily)